jgi:1-deoxy-D-xylulose-5-phosphate reductoisomerase
MQRITILGATGSIGASTLDVLARHPEQYQVYALSAHTRVEELAAACRSCRPARAVVGSADAAARLAALIADLPTSVEYGEQALCDIASNADTDTVMAAIVGAAGLAPTLAAARAGKKVLLANKEALVMSGQLFMDAVREHNATLLPIDSEHNAIFQSLPAAFGRVPAAAGVAKILLTASGGPFLNRAVETLGDVTPDEACKHPNWVMGRKISVDSATGQPGHAHADRARTGLPGPDRLGRGPARPDADGGAAVLPARFHAFPVSGPGLRRAARRWHGPGTAQRRQ